MANQPLVLLVEPKGTRNPKHAGELMRAGFRVMSVASEDVDIVAVLEQGPAVVAAQLDGSGSSSTLNLARRFRQTPQARLIPFVIYGHELRPGDIEEAARIGALWVQVEPGDGARLVAVARGLIRASDDSSVEDHPSRQ
jgi:hypothetical protein